MFGRETEPLPFDDNDPDADLRLRSEKTTHEILAFYARARVASDRVTTSSPSRGPAPPGSDRPCRCTGWLIHMVEETARHAGHVEILRELIDGMVADQRGA
jgi:Protein of unknown function (DUF664)